MARIIPRVALTAGVGTHDDRQWTKVKLLVDEVLEILES